MAQRIGVLGPQGTHSEAAGHYLVTHLLPGGAAELVMEPDIYECLLAAEEGRVDAALVPVENSLEGAINITLDTLADSPELTVVRELIWPVHNQLMAKCRPDEVTRIYSHPQPISQCREYLREHYPQAEIIKTSSTARAAELVAEEPAFLGWAAICPQRAGELYGLNCLAAEIQDNMANCTRFFQVQKMKAGAPPPPSAMVPRPHRGRTNDAVARQDCKLLAICQIDGHRPGALYEVLGEFAHRHINMTRIESRPARTELGEYIFFFDLEFASCTGEALGEALAAVAKKSIWLKQLGPFPIYEAQP